MTAIYAPLFPATAMLLSPAFSVAGWQSLFRDPQLPQALIATLVSTTLATLGSLLLRSVSCLPSGPASAGSR